MCNVPWDMGYSRSPHGERGLKFRSRADVPVGHSSLSSWRAWIEIEHSRTACLIALGRSPHGERGLKCCLPKHLVRTCRRSPHGERGLKCGLVRIVLMRMCSRSPHGERGLKFPDLSIPSAQFGRSPHGERGLKWATCCGMF